MKLIFAGTPEFAASALDALIAAGHELVLVLTQPDRPAGRGLRLESSAVKKVSQKHGLTVYQPQSLKGGEATAKVAEVNADAMIVAAYGLILPQAILHTPRLGCINIHASLLPRWRGAAPIQRALLAGDQETGITIMQMDQGLDTGAMLMRRALSIGEAETAGELHDRLAALGAELIVEVLQQLPPPTPQNPALATYAAKISKDEAFINWHETATVISRKVRAYNPYPGAVTTLSASGAERIKIWRAIPAEQQGKAGRRCDGGSDELMIGCAQGALKVIELQRAGGKRLATAQFLAGFSLAPDARFGE